MNRPQSNTREFFNRIAQRTSEFVGAPMTFLVSLALVVVWFASGPMFAFSDSWQLVLNTGLSIGTFLIVLLLQNFQNREGKAIQLKLDELLRGVQGSRTEMVKLEELTEDELDKLQEDFRSLRDGKRFVSATREQPPAPTTTQPADRSLAP